VARSKSREIQEITKKELSQEKEGEVKIEEENEKEKEMQVLRDNTK